MYQYKNIKHGFVIICPNCNIGQLKTTISSIKYGYKNSSYICVIPDNCHNIQEISKLCTVFSSGSTITSLINVGMQNVPCDEWNFFIIAGTWVRPMLDQKYSYFMEDNKDIMFPIVDKKLNFVDGSMNGILMHKTAFSEIGPFSNDNPLEICKLMWAMEAIEKRYQFKAVLGTIVC